jgi:hypothetical protein
VETRPVTVVETGIFIRQAEKIWTDEERNVLIDHVARDPDAGDVIPGTGGVRKLRWGRTGSGKRGGARVIYFWIDADRPIYLLLAYAKTVREDMTADEKRAVAALAAALKNEGKQAAK